MADDIHSAINAVMAEVGYVQKERSEALRYSFAGERALIEALRPHMVEHGITMHVSRVLDRSFDVYMLQRRDGETRMSHAVVVLEVTFTHASSGTSITAQATGEGSDSGDKAYNKALTGAYKYALRQTFVIETGDDPDRENPNDQPPQKGRGTPQNARGGTKAPPKDVDTATGEILPPNAPTAAPLSSDAKLIGKWMRDHGYKWNEPATRLALAVPIDAHMEPADVNRVIAQWRDDGLAIETICQMIEVSHEGETGETP